MSKQTFMNQTHIEGILYQHSLVEKETGERSKNPGTKYISGTIDIATNDAITNIVQVHYSYVTEMNSKGGKNQTYTILKNILDGAVANYMADGNAAAKVKIDSAIALNDFYTTRNNEEILVSAKRNEGGFIHVIDSLNEDEKKRNTFKCDMVITKVTRVEPDVEKNIPEKVIVKGCIFDYRKALLPVEFTALNANAMNYFDGLGATDKSPVFTQLWGRQVSTTVSREIRTESAFGDDDVRTIENTRKDWVITGASKTPYDWDDDSTITADELNKMEVERNTYLATIKQRADEYRESKNSVPAAGKGSFNF